MPTRDEIQKKIETKAVNAQDEVRRSFLRQLSKHTKRHTIIYAVNFMGNPVHTISVNNQDIQGFMSALHKIDDGDSLRKLDLILHSPGGSMDAAEQIVNYLRAKYDHIRAIIPQNAMSAATMIACACDEIIMGKHSAIGPIDPQISLPQPNPNMGYFMTPAQSILDEFETAKRDVKNDPSTAPLWVKKIEAYPPGLLDVCATNISGSIKLVTKWLDLYMFSGIKSGKSPSEKIANWLGDANLHKTHGKPISMQEAEKKQLNVKPLEDDPKLQELVLSAFHATIVTFMRTSCIKIIENHKGKGTYYILPPSNLSLNLMNTQRQLSEKKEEPV